MLYTKQTQLVKIVFAGCLKRTDKTRFNMYCAKVVYLRTKRARTATYYLQNCHGGHLIGTAMHLLVSPTQDLCPKSRHDFNGHNVPLRGCAWWGSSPALGDAPVACFELFFLWFWLVKSRATWPWEQPTYFVDCNNYYVAMMKMRALWTPPINHMVGRQSGSQQCLQIGDFRWCHWICVKVWWRCWELSKSYCIDWSNSSKLPNL